MSRVWIGDWLRAWRGGIAKSDENARELARMMDLVLPRAAPEVSLVLEETSEPIEDRDESEPGFQSHRINDEREAEDPEQLVQPSDGPIVLGESTRREAPEVTWRIEGELPPQSRRLPDQVYEPLFDRSVARAVIAAIAAEWRPEGEINLQEAVEMLARRDRMTRLPRRLVSTVRGGLAIVLVRTRMEPFANDIRDLMSKLRDVVGKEAVQAWWLDARGITSADRARSWPPAPGMPVLFVAPEPSEVKQHAPMLLARGSAVVALVPGRPERPADLPREVALVGWDHRTRVRQALRARREARR